MTQRAFGVIGLLIIRRMNLKLYVTDACSLCDTAFDLIFAMPELTGHVLESIDIATSDTLFEQLGDSIPVLEVANQQLLWPFTQNEVSDLVQTALSRCLG